MMTLKDLLKKKSHIESTSSFSRQRATSASEPEEKVVQETPEFTFLRTTTTTQEHITLPSYPGDEARKSPPKQISSTPRDIAQLTPEKKKHGLFRRTSNNKQTQSGYSIAEDDEGRKASSESLADGEATGDKSELSARPKSERKLSDRFRMRAMSRSSSRSSVSANLPEGLSEAPDGIVVPVSTDAPSKDNATGIAAKPTVVKEDRAAKESREAAWEKRATNLVLHKPNSDTSTSPERQPRSQIRTPSEQASDEATLQEAIRLHETGDLTTSTLLFSRLADPRGANNALSQVLYGLALRHGWGVPSNPSDALHYLTLAASNSASIESAALHTSSAGGVAKGELVLAVFELANCMRYGWGVAKDPVAARAYYETAANLGDADALEESAWCCLEGYGGPKDKFRAAQYLRSAELLGKKGVGNSWIWKDKYNPKS